MTFKRVHIIVLDSLGIGKRRMLRSLMLLDGYLWEYYEGLQKVQYTDMAKLGIDNIRPLGWRKTHWLITLIRGERISDENGRFD